MKKIKWIVFGTIILVVVASLFIYIFSFCLPKYNATKEYTAYLKQNYTDDVSVEVFYDFKTNRYEALCQHDLNSRKFYLVKDEQGIIYQIPYDNRPVYTVDEVVTNWCLDYAYTLDKILYTVDVGENENKVCMFTTDTSYICLMYIFNQGMEDEDLYIEYECVRYKLSDLTEDTDDYKVLCEWDGEYTLYNIFENPQKSTVTVKGNNVPVKTVTVNNNLIGFWCMASDSE